MRALRPGRPFLSGVVVEGQGAWVGKERSGREGRPEGGGIQLPAVAWAVPEPVEENTRGAEAGAAVEAPAAVGAAGAAPQVAPPQGAGPAAGAAGAAGAPAGVTAVAGAGAFGQDPAAEEAGARRIPKPMVAAAVIAGLVLAGVPLGIAGFGGDGPGPHGADGPPPAGYSQPDGGGDGYVPGADAPGNPPADQPLQPGQPAQPAGAPAPGEGVVPAAVGAAAAAALPGVVPAPGGGQGAAPGTGRPAGGGAAPGQAAPPASAQGGGQGGGQGAGAPQTQPQQPPAAQQPPAGQQPAPPPAKPVQPAPPPPPTYNGVAGPGCGGSTSMQLIGWYDNGQEGWRKNSGGYTGDGCSGGFTSVPMSGDANDDKSNSVVWTFNTGSLTTGTCQLSVYVPNGDLKAVGGAPTYYTVQNKTFPVNQVASRGQWVSAGSFPLSGGRIAVVMHSRGLDWNGGTKTYAHHAASAVKANCTG
ncbi:hypothetical protein [Streptomyces sp. NRRL S-350]|uniref:hypothetical protein n=1 Tax=Streptomyces sp. NRRL S-350 TaxID=1463902 RepID=UPI0004C271FA|nr:hypothetical protein [Streptomyces sp. NRRL S-350]